MIPKRFTRKRKSRLPLDGLDDDPGPVVIAGGSGFLGRFLARSLVDRHHKVVILSRKPGPDYGRIRTVVWDGKTVGDWGIELDGATALVNLAGRSIACAPTPENRREILESRLNATRALLDACSQCAEPPPVMVQASSLAIYGDTGDQLCDETAPYGNDWAADVCQQWEAALFKDFLGPRRVAVRIGLVLGRQGGALQPLSMLAKCFLGGSVGNGRQYVSWINIEDVCSMIRWSILISHTEGAYNATSPYPVTNAEFMRVLRKAVNRPWSPPAPAWAVKLGARYLMRVDPELVLSSRRCVPTKFLKEGFQPLRNDLLMTMYQQLWIPRY